MLTCFRKTAYIMAYAVATIPLWHYIHDGRILALMVAVVTFAYLNVVLSTVEAAQPILSSEKAKTPLPRWLPDKPKYQKWWMLVRHTLKWHLLLIPAKMGLALGFTQFLLVYYMRLPFTGAYNYLAHNTNPDYVPHVFPQWETVLLAMVFFVLFMILEAYLLAAICVVVKRRHIVYKSVVLVFMIRITIGLVGIGFGTISQSIVMYPWSTYCHWYTSHNENVGSYKIFVNPVGCFKLRSLETLYTAVMTPFDQSVLLSANIMRPLSQLTNRERGYCVSNSCESGEQKTYDNRPFVARQIVAGILGLLLYAGATWVVLWFVEDEVVQE